VKIFSNEDLVMKPQDYSIINHKSKELFIMKFPDSPDQFKRILNPIENHFNRILTILKISDVSGELVSIKFDFDTEKPDRCNPRVARVRKNPFIYKIRMPAGISYRLWGESRFFLYRENILSWIDKCEINDKKLENFNKKEILANYAYFLGSYLLLLHELSHVILGHFDFNYDHKNKYLSKFKDERQRSAQKARIEKALEAEADRQAGELLPIFFENSLGDDGLGGYLRFPSRLEAYEFYIYAIASTFKTLQTIKPGKRSQHPNLNERFFVMLGALSKYLKQNFPQQHDEIYFHALKSCLKAGEKLMLQDTYDFLVVMKNAMNLAFVDDVVNEIEIRRYQHKLELMT